MPTGATKTLAVLLQAASCSALALLTPRLPGAAPASAAATAPLAPLVGRIAAPLCTRARSVRMDGSIYDEFLATDVATGERKIIGFAEKEKLYLDCLDAYYNDEKPVLSDDEYKQLKSDLEFEGSKLTAFSQDEIKFLVANKRYRESKPVLTDKDYDALRKKLKDSGSQVVLHEAPSCKVSGECKMDLRVDWAKQRLLYVPGFALGLVVFGEVEFWLTHLDPFLLITLALLPSYLFTKWFTENIFCQNPLVTSSACPNCNYLVSVYFGDLFNVQKDDVLGKGYGPAGDIVDITCPNCKAELTADRSKMVISGVTTDTKVKAR